MLLEYSRQYSLDSWLSWVPFFERGLLSTREARELLADVHGRLTEGFQTADCARAGALLLQLSEAR
jgi:hypothetical protein